MDRQWFDDVAMEAGEEDEIEDDENQPLEEDDVEEEQEQETAPLPGENWKYQQKATLARDTKGRKQQDIGDAETDTQMYGNAKTSELIQGLDDLEGDDSGEDAIEDTEQTQDLINRRPHWQNSQSQKQQRHEDQDEYNQDSQQDVSPTQASQVTRRRGLNSDEFNGANFPFETSTPVENSPKDFEHEIPQREILQAFKLQGLTLHKQALTNIQNVLRRERKPEQALEMILAGIQQYIEREGGSDTVINSDCVSEVVAQLSKNKDDFKAESLQVFSSFRIPKFEYNSVHKKFFRDHSKRALHSSAAGKVSMNRERFELIKQRLLRQPAFSAPLIKSNKSQGYIQLTPIDNLRNTNKETCYVLAMLTNPETGKYALEDLNKRVSCTFADENDLGLAEGIYTDGSIVLVEGEYDMDNTDSSAVVEETGGLSGVFTIHTMGHPPPELRADSLKAMGTVDPYGIIQTPGDYQRAIDLQTRAEDAYWVIISDLHLDNPEVLGKIKHMLDVYSELRVVPSVFILMGNFCSMPFGAHFDDATTFVRRMNDFADLVGDYTEIATNSHFILIPGPNDPGCGRILPRRSLPHSFCKRLKQKIHNVTLATNPARIRFFAQDVVVFRDDITTRLVKNCVKYPQDATDNSDSYSAIKTMVDQSHLCPLPLSLQPVYWDFDYSLRLYPAPDTLIMGEDHPHYLHNYNDVCAFNPSSFPLEWRFTVYRPAQRTVEVSRVKVPEN